MEANGGDAPPSSRIRGTTAGRRETLVLSRTKIHQTTHFGGCFAEFCGGDAGEKSACRQAGSHQIEQLIFGWAEQILNLYAQVPKLLVTGSPK